MIENLKAAACKYALNGVAVLPLVPQGKVPKIRGGVHSASFDMSDTVDRWTASPDANIGIATGKCSRGIIVIDIDVKNGTDGEKSLESWQEQNGRLPENLTAKTPSGGRHLYYRVKECEYGNRVGLLPGVDIRANGGYVVAPPSVLPNGSYEWLSKEGKVADANDIVLLLLNWGKFDDMAPKTFEMPEVVETGQRNNTLFKLACSMRDKGVNHRAILAALMETNAEFPEPLEDEEVKTIARSASKYAAKHDVTAEKGVVKKVITDLSMTSLSEVEIKEPEWLIDGYFPKNQITIIGGDGGTGKTTLWTSIAASISTGKVPIFEHYICGDLYRDDPQNVIFFSAEDDVERVLKPKLLANGANMENIKCIDLMDERFKNLKFGNPFLEGLISYHRPRLTIFDPLQAFIGEKVRMGDRNSMREAIAPLISLCMKYETTVLILMHANKRPQVWGRNRLADSADIWDIARSVMLTGKTDNGLFYVSPEKNNYAPLSKTLLFSIEDGNAKYKALTDKHDRDFIMADHYKKTQAPARESAKNLIVDYLKEHGEVPVAELDDFMVNAMSVSKDTLKKAKSELKAENITELKAEGSAKEKTRIFKLSLRDG